MSRRTRILGIAAGGLLAVGALILVVHRSRATLADRAIGKSHSEVRSLVGNPLERQIPGWDGGFLLGDEDGYFSVDGKWLVVRYESGRVVAARIITD